MESFCCQCGSKLQLGAKFCQGCGRQIENAFPAAAIPSAHVPSAPPIAQQPLPPQASKKEQVFTQNPPDKSAEKLDGSGSSGLLTNRIAFVFSYLLVATPTYIFPYFGSNSALINGTSTAMGLGALPQFWYHLLALYLLVVIAWLRGAHTGRRWIAIFPFLAGIFDMVPGLNWFFLIPTAFHVVTLIIGVKGDVVRATDAGAPRQRLAIASAGMVALIILSVFKTQSFFQTAEKGPSWERAPAKSIQNETTPVSPLAMHPKIAPFASSDDAWATYTAEVTSKCIQASELRDAKLVGDFIEYGDRVGFSAALVTGVYPQPHMKNQTGRSLCLFDRRTRVAHASPADDVK